MSAVLSAGSLVALCLAAARFCRSIPAGLLAGAAAWAAAGWVALLAGAGRTSPFWLELMLIALAASALLHRSPHAPPAASPVRWQRALLVAAACLAVASFAVEVAWTPDGGWDATMMWTYKARLLAGPEPLRAVLDPRLYHNDYPLLVPLMTARLGAIVATAWMPAFVAFLFASLGAAAVWSLAPAHSRDLAAALLLATPLFARLAAAQYADAPLGMLVAIAVGLSLRGDLAAGGAVAGLLPFVKNEGILYLVALAFAVLVTTPRAALRFALAAAPGALLAASYKLSPSMQTNDIVAGIAPGPVTSRLADASRWLTILRTYAKESVDVLTWGVGPWLVAAAFARTRPRFGLAFLGAALAGLTFVYLATPRPLEWHLTSLSRVLFHLWPAAIVLAANASPDEKVTSWT